MAELQLIILLRNFVRHIEICTSNAVRDLAHRSMYNYAQTYTKQYLLNKRLSYNQLDVKCFIVASLESVIRFVLSS